MTQPVNPQLRVVDEIRDFILPLSNQQLLHLERNLLAEGCRDPIVVWEKSQGEYIIIDGHHRYEICKKHTIAFDYKTLNFHDIEDVKLWMIENQIGRRNLNNEQLSYYRGLKYLSLRKKKGGFDNVKLKGKFEDPTSEVLSKEFHVSPSTIKRDSAFAECLNYIGQLDPSVKLQILSGTVKATKSQIRGLVKGRDREKVEAYLESIRTSLYNKCDPTKFGIDPKDRLVRIRGMLISTITRLMKDRRKEDLDELRALIVKFEAELFPSQGSAHYHHGHHSRFDIDSRGESRT